jgi:hypothetical protein
MRVKYKVGNRHGLHVITYATVGWVDWFVREVYRQLLGQKQGIPGICLKGAERLTLAGAACEDTAAQRQAASRQRGHLRLKNIGQHDKNDEIR